MGEHFGMKLTKDGVTSTFHENPDDAKFGDHAHLRGMPQHGRPPQRQPGLRPTSPTGSVEAPLQQHGVQPAAVFESDRGQPAGVDEAPIAVQRKGSVGVVVHDDGDDLPDTGI